MDEPPRKRPRMLSKACEMCKAKKSRCDSARPSCSLCRQKGTACEYREKGQPGLRPGYGKAMETRMAVLEDSMQQMSASMQEVLQQLRRRRRGPGVVSGVSAGSGSGSGSRSCSGSGSGSEHGSLGDETDGSTVGRPMSYKAPKQHGLPTEASGHVYSPDTAAGEWLLAPAAATTDNTHLPAAAPTDNTTDLPLPGLPPRHVLHDLVDLFFDRIYPWAPLFHRPSLNCILAATDPASDRLLLLHGITVLCFRFWTKPTPSPADRDAHVRASRDQVLLRTIDACSLVSTQALTLLALDAVGQGPGPRTWNIMAMLVAAARQLILATRPPNRPQDEANTPVVNDEGEDDEKGKNTANVHDAAANPHSAPASIEAEEKRRLFWVIYSLDRFASIFHGQPGAIDTQTIRLLYPASDEEWGRPPTSPEWFQGGDGGGGGGGDSSSGVSDSGGSHTTCRANLWHHYIDALTLFDRSHRLLIQPVNVSMPAHCLAWQSKFRRLDGVLAAWFAGLPASVRDGLPGRSESESESSPPPPHPVLAMLYASYLLSAIRMYMIASFPATTSAYLRPSLAARTRLRAVCHDLALLVAACGARDRHDLQGLGPSFVFVVWVGARSLVILWTRGGYREEELCKSSNTSCLPLPPDLETLLTALRHMAGPWPCAQRYVDIIQMIIDTKNSPGGPPGLDIFNDPRRTTYVIQSRFKALANERQAALDRVGAEKQKKKKQQTPPSYPPYTQHQQAYPSQQAHPYHSYPYSTEPLMSMAFPQSLDFFDMPLLDAYDVTGPLIGTGTFGTELDSEWL